MQPSSATEIIKNTCELLPVFNKLFLLYIPTDENSKAIFEEYKSFYQTSHLAAVVESADIEVDAFNAAIVLFNKKLNVTAPQLGVTIKFDSLYTLSNAVKLKIQSVTQLHTVDIILSNDEFTLKVTKGANAFNLFNREPITVFGISCNKAHHDHNLIINASARDCDFIKEVLNIVYPNIKDDNISRKLHGALNYLVLKV